MADEWAFHDEILGAKDQIKAQCGGDSGKYAAMGLTKKSERYSPKRVKTAKPPAKSALD